LFIPVLGNQSSSMQDRTHTAQTTDESLVQGSYTRLFGETYYRIQNSHLMPEFFVSIVGADDHWMFVSSRGALTAGRRNPDGAIFPYAADDQISAMREHTGPITFIRTDASSHVWQPFAGADETCQVVERSLYKSSMGNKIVFEERDQARGLTFRYRWAFSPRYGFVRDCWLENTGNSAQRISLLDGVQNLLPYGVGSDFWMRYSNLGNAYKKNERVPDADLAVFYLSSIPSDRAEPSEGLRATTAWHCGFTPEATLLSTHQLHRFLCGDVLATEDSVRGRAGAFLVSTTEDIGAGESLHWRQVLDLGKDQTDVVDLDAWLKTVDDPMSEVDSDIAAGETKLRKLIASADGLQCGRNLNRVHRHFSNTLFNVMRGGVPLRNYLVGARDFCKHLAGFNRTVLERHRSTLDDLPSEVSHVELNDLLHRQGDPDLVRVGLEYLPLAFSRRHGDPTRPWNRFSIDLRGPDGENNLNYQGNWRDIFQNWEALGLSFPAFFPAMICRFVNATTADGYNAYRLTKDGLEWEEPFPEDPWSNIGYWSDHQIIYLLKLLEWNSRFHPNSSRKLLSERVFVHAEVPYRIKPFEHIKADPRNTIEFDWDLARDIEKRVHGIGADGKLLRNRAGQVHHVTLVEKLLTLSLAKLSNFVPDGGVWLNTQRPEWNDANNALVGNGLSMVTTCYLHRWFAFLESWIGTDQSPALEVSAEVAALLQETGDILVAHRSAVREGFTAEARARMVTLLSQAGSSFRSTLYGQGPSGDTRVIERSALAVFLADARQLMEASIRSNRRKDGLYHSYNLLDWKGDQLKVDTLYEMLEGQVAVLSSGLLSTQEANEVLRALRNSALFRTDQESYLLYPDRQLPSFLNKNRIPDARVQASPLLRALLDAADIRIVKRDRRNGVHFNGDFRNAAELNEALGRLGEPYSALVEAHRADVVGLFEEVFEHRKFTGRSGTFFAYEGLGSIYWHMVSKLGLAVSEHLDAAVSTDAAPDQIEELKAHLKEIRDGIGAEKHPAKYGAFPTDPYSHTPEKAGVKQPGMTGQVKEDVIARFMELGVLVNRGRIGFHLRGFDPAECVPSATEYVFYTVEGAEQKVRVPAGGFAFSYCQVPVVYQPGQANSVRLQWADGAHTTLEGSTLDEASSDGIFRRTGQIVQIDCLWRDLL
jgi:hypothetical protein